MRRLITISMSCCNIMFEGVRAWLVEVFHNACIFEYLMIEMKALESLINSLK